MENLLVPLFKAPKLSDILKFEIKSWVGRHFKKKRSIIRPQQNPILLDMGVGGNYLDGWTHADFYIMPSIKIWKKYPERRIPDLELDLRYPIMCPDNAVDGIYCGHTIEHLYPDEALNLIDEMFRILKPTCWLRINVPDLEKYVNFYVGKESSKEFSEYQTGCDAISALTQNWGHHSTWDRFLLCKVLQSVGFINVKKVNYGIEGSDARLIKEEDVRKWETLVIEAQKPS